MKQTGVSRFFVLSALFTAVLFMVVHGVCFADEDEIPILYIGSEVVNESNLEGEGWSYDTKGRTLTLDDYKYYGDGTSPDGDISESRASIRTSGDVIVKLIGDSEIVTSDGSKKNYGIYSKGDLTFSGEGTLTVKSGNAVYDKDHDSSSSSIGIAALGDENSDSLPWSNNRFYNPGMIYVKDTASVIVTAGDAEYTSTAVYAVEYLSVSDSGRLSAVSGRASASTGISAYAIYAGNNGYIESHGGDGTEIDRSTGASADNCIAGQNAHMIFTGHRAEKSIGMQSWVGFYGINIQDDAIIECYADRRSDVKKPVGSLQEEHFEPDPELWNTYPEGLITGLIGNEFDDYLEDCKDAIDEGVCGDDLKWYLTKYGDLVIDGTGSMYDYGENGVSNKAPWEIDGDQITTIAILPGVNSIGNSAFRGFDMPGLVSLKIADSVENIGSRAFDQAITGVLYGNLILPVRLKELGESAFSGCSGIIGNVVIPDDLVSVEKSAFEDCGGITGITMGNKVETIGDYAFADCGKIREAAFSKSLKTIGDDAFRGCNMLIRIDLPESLREIGESSFAECGDLSEVLFEGNAPSIGKDAFSGCFGSLVLMYRKTASGWSTPYWNGYRAFPEHEHDGASVSIRPATTDSDGRLDHICSVCGVRSSRESIPKIDEDSFEAGTVGVYTGDEIRPAVSVKDKTGEELKQGTDYDVVYKDNINAGTGTVEIVFKEKYAGRLSREFTITPRDLSSMKAVLSYSSYVYNGAAKQPAVTITGLTAGKDFDVTYADNVNAGTAKAMIAGKGNYCGDQTLAFKITPASITSKKITLSATKYAYNGKVRKPSVKVEGVTSDNYIVKYSNVNSKNVGTYSVTVNGKSNYTGSKTLTYQIIPKATSIKSLTAGSKSFTVKWSKVSAQATGYQIQYSKSSTFASGNKTSRITSYKTVSKKIAGLTAKKKYYVRVRTYKTVKDKNYYSAWSAKKSVTTKS